MPHREVGLPRTCPSMVQTAALRNDRSFPCQNDVLSTRPIKPEKANANSVLREVLADPFSEHFADPEMAIVASQIAQHSLDLPSISLIVTGADTAPPTATVIAHSPAFAYTGSFALSWRGLSPLGSDTYSSGSRISPILTRTLL